MTGARNVATPDRGSKGGVCEDGVLWFRVFSMARAIQLRWVKLASQIKGLRALRLATTSLGYRRPHQNPSLVKTERTSSRQRQHSYATTASLVIADAALQMDTGHTPDLTRSCAICKLPVDCAAFHLSGIMSAKLPSRRCACADGRWCGEVCNGQRRRRNSHRSRSLHQAQLSASRQQTSYGVWGAAGLGIERETTSLDKRCPFDKRNHRSLIGGSVLLKNNTLQLLVSSIKECKHRCDILES